MNRRSWSALVCAAAMGVAPAVFAQDQDHDQDQDDAAETSATISDPVAVSGVVVSQTPEALVIRDDTGRETQLRVTELTRFIWAETSAVSDLRTGARVRALYEQLAGSPRALEVWIVAPPAGRGRS